MSENRIYFIMQNLSLCGLKGFDIHCPALQTFGGMIEVLQLVILGIMGL